MLVGSIKPSFSRNVLSSLVGFDPGDVCCFLRLDGVVIRDFIMSFIWLFWPSRFTRSLTSNGRFVCTGWSRGVYDNVLNCLLILVLRLNCFMRRSYSISRLLFIISIVLTFSNSSPRRWRIIDCATTFRSYRKRSFSFNLSAWTCCRDF